MDKYYVSGCIEIEENYSQVEDDKADFFTLYERDEDGLSEAIFNLGTRKDAEEMMAVYVERDALQEQVQKLAAENAALKTWGLEAIALWEAGCDMDSHLDHLPFAVTTDAVIREIGARAVDGFGIYHNFSDKLFIQQEAQKYAAKLRAGEVS